MKTTLVESFITKQLVVLVFIVVCEVYGYSARPSLRIIPRTAAISEDQTLTVQCKADRKLVGCQFHIRGEDVVDFSSGIGATAPGNHSWYRGAGLSSGVCGMQMRVKNLPGVNVLGCRVRAETGGWVYADMTFYVGDGNTGRPNPFEIIDNYRKRIVVLPGENIKIGYTFNSPISESEQFARCIFEIPGAKELGKDIRNQQGRIIHLVKYNHSSSHCEIAINNVEDGNSGWLFGHLKTSSYQNNSPLPKVSIIVAKSPEAFDMEVNSPDGGNLYREGDNLIATCQANFSRPLPNITWYFGDDVIRSDDDDDSPISSEWFWDYEEQSITQIVNRRLSWQDDGKTLICQMTHLAYYDTDGDNVSEIINIDHSKTKWSNVEPVELRQYELVVGHHALITVNTDRWSINRPTFLWRVNNVTIREDEIDGDYRYHAERAVLEEDRRWVASLLILSVRMEDADNQFLLIAGDDSERREFLVAVTVVDLKVQYFFVTLLCGLTAIFAVLSLVYYKDIRRWLANPSRFRQGCMTYNSGRILNSPDRRSGEHMF